MRQDSVFVCEMCGYETKKWLGQCPNCSEYGSFSESVALPQSVYSENLKVQRIKDIKLEDLKRTSTDISELDRVLGGGLVPAQVVLLSGEPGIGKSTLLLQLASKLSNNNKKVIYISVEESNIQVAMRAKRVLSKENDNLLLLSAYELDSILSKVQKEKPDVIIMDSIQTFFSKDLKSLPGSVAQIRMVASKLVSNAKQKNIITIIVGQITKEGSIAGPKLLEHLVDTVLHLEGDEKQGLRVLRTFKNRFGSTNEVGIFEMDEIGMKVVADPSKQFLSGSNSSRIGVCPTVILEGNRPLIIEVQALCASTPFSLPKRVSAGISKSKIEVLSAIISKYAKVNLSNKDIYVNIAGGIKSNDPALDLAVILAIYSSYKNKQLPTGIAGYGEVSLTGEIKKAVRHSQRDKEVKRMGFRPFIETYPTIKHISNIFKAL